MLRWSGLDQDVAVDLDAIASGHGSVGVPFGDELLAFASAAAVLRGPTEKVRHLGEELLATKGVLHGEITLTRGEGTLNRWR